MDLLDEMIKKTFKKIEGGNSDFCGTPGADTKKLTGIAKSIVLGKDNVDLLGSVGQENKHRKDCKKGCSH